MLRWRPRSGELSKEVKADKNAGERDEEKGKGDESSLRLDRGKCFNILSKPAAGIKNKSHLERTAPRT